MLKTANVTLHLSSFHPLHVAKTLAWQKQIKSGIIPTMGWYLPRSSGYVTSRGTTRTSRAIKALLSPVPPRHPWLQRISTWAGNLSSRRFAVTLKSTSYDLLQCKALWTPDDAYLSRSSVVTTRLWGLVDHIRQSAVDVGYSVEIMQNVLSSPFRRNAAFTPS